MSRLPEALVAGAMKAGTTWIYDYLACRDDVCLPAGGVKETFFFDKYWPHGLSWYAKFFERAGGRHTFEVASTYFHDPSVPARVRDALGEVPVLVTLRDPVRRAWSHYLHLKRYGQTRASLMDAVIQYPDILKASRYDEAYRRWLGVFPAECIRFVWQDQLIQQPDEYVKAVCDALNIEYRPVSEALLNKSNAGAVSRSYLLARTGSAVTNRLRDVGLFSVIRVAKRLGLKRVFYGKPGSTRGLQPTGEEQAWLEKQLRNVIPAAAEAVRNTPTHSAKGRAE